MCPTDGSWQFVIVSRSPLHLFTCHKIKTMVSLCCSKRIHNDVDDQIVNRRVTCMQHTRSPFLIGKDSIIQNSWPACKRVWIGSVLHNWWIARSNSITVPNTFFFCQDLMLLWQPSLATGVLFGCQAVCLLMDYIATCVRCRLWCLCSLL